MIAGLKPVLLGKSAWATVLTTMTIKLNIMYPERQWKHWKKLLVYKCLRSWLGAPQMLYNYWTVQCFIQTLATNTFW